MLSCRAKSRHLYYYPAENSKRFLDYARNDRTCVDMTTTADFFQQTSKVLTVSELTRSIRGTLETKFGTVWVQGEVSNYKLHPSGHQYFTLKDARAQIACVIFRNTMAPLRQPLVDGTQAIPRANERFRNSREELASSRRRAAQRFATCSTLYSAAHPGFKF